MAARDGVSTRLRQLLPGWHRGARRQRISGRTCHQNRDSDGRGAHQSTRCAHFVRGRATRLHAASQSTRLGNRGGRAPKMRAAWCCMATSGTVTPWQAARAGRASVAAPGHLASASENHGVGGPDAQCEQGFPAVTGKCSGQVSFTSLDDLTSEEQAGEQKAS